MKKIILGLLAGIMIFGLVACGGSESANTKGENGGEERDYKIGVVVKTTENPHFKGMLLGAENAGKDLGVEVIPMATQQEGQINEQIQMCEDLISRGVKGLVVTPQNSTGIATAVQSARDSNVVFVPIDTMVEGEKVDTYIGLDNAKAASNVATKVAEKIGEKGNVIIIQGMAGASSSIDRTRGFEEAFAKYPNINVVASQNADYQQTKALEVVADLLQSNKDIAAIVCCNDLMALGAATALEEAGYDVGENGVIVSGMDGSLPALESIKAGKLYATEFLWPEYYGYWGVQAAINLIEGKGAPSLIETPSTSITKENVDNVMPIAKDIANYSF